MFQIRNDQWDAFSDQAVRDFEQRLTDHLMEVNPECSALLGDELMTQTIRGGIRKAVANGIEMESNVAQFVQMQLEEGFNFEDEPAYAASKQILLDNDLHENVKVAMLQRSVEDIEDPSIASVEADTLDEDEEPDEEDRDPDVNVSLEDDEDDEFEIGDEDFFEDDDEFDDEA